MGMVEKTCKIVGQAGSPSFFAIILYVIVETLYYFLPQSSTLYIYYPYPQGSLLCW